MNLEEEGPLRPRHQDASPMSFSGHRGLQSLFPFLLPVPLQYILTRMEQRGLVVRQD